MAARDSLQSLKGTFWKSFLFHDAYLDKDVSVDSDFAIDGDIDFENCFTELMDLFAKWKESEIEGWTETETINEWVKPILRALGWTCSDESGRDPFAEETSFSINKHVYRADILIADSASERELSFADRNMSGELKLQNAKKHVLIPVEAKYWNRLHKQSSGKLDKKEEQDKTKETDSANSLGPNGQTLKYMEILDRDWGILTDGATWRLFNRELGKESQSRYLEFNIYNLYRRATRALVHEKDAHVFRDATKFFYSFFSKKALFAKDQKEQLVQKALQESKSYADHVEEDLKDRFISAINIVCNGMSRAAIKKEDRKNLDLLRSISESHLFNILFIRSCEARHILPIKAPEFYEISLSRVIDALHSFDPNKYEKSPKEAIKLLAQSFTWFEFDENGNELFDILINLTELIQKGTHGKNRGFQIEGFRESVFTNDEWKFAKETKLSNMEMVLALFELSFSKAPTGTLKGYQEIPYSFFTPRQLGSIYESFLEYQLSEAPFDMVFNEKQWKEANLDSDKVKKLKSPKVRKGNLFFTPDNSERKASGSYYTPQYVVEYLVKSVLEPLCRDKSSDEILELRVCDPAMGSGHFLNEALKYLTAKYLSALDSEVMDDITLTPEEIKRIVLDKCLFGADLNARAVKLARLSLWLESAHAGKKLERLDDQLICGDSLVTTLPKYAPAFSWDEKLFVPKKFKKFDATVGNPPYGAQVPENVDSYLTATYPDSYGQTKDVYTAFIERSLDITKPHGRTGFIIPSAWLGGPDYSDFRGFILSKKIYELINMPYGVFKDAYIDTCLLFASDAKADSDHEVACFSYDKKQKLESIELENESFSQVQQQRWTATKDQKIVLHEDSVDLIASIRGKFSSKLSDVAEIKRGVLFDKNLLTTKKSSKISYPYFEGDTYRYQIKDSSSNWIEFNDKMKERPKEIKWFEGNRILLRRLVNRRQRLMAHMTKDTLITNKNLYVILPLTTEIPLESILAILNSKVYSYLYISQVSQATKDDFPQVTITDLKDLPFPSLKSISQKWKKMEPCFHEIVRLGALAITRNQDGSDLVTEFQREDAKMEKMIFELFELTDKEIKYIESHFAKFGQDYPQTKKTTKAKKAA